MMNAPLDSGNAPLNRLRELISSGNADADDLDGLLADLERASLLEHAVLLLAPLRTDPAWGAFRNRLKAECAQFRERRMNRWQVDPERRTLRLAFEADGPACHLNPQSLVATLARALLDAGLPLAMGLEKSPRPVVHTAFPLPLDVPGREEWADAGFSRTPECPPSGLPALVNAGAPEGLRVLRCGYVPNFATPVAELCRAAWWRWTCPAGCRAEAEARVAAFLAAPSFLLEKPGKTGGQKGVKHVEVRPLVLAMDWEGANLAFRTRVGQGAALNPRRLLGAVLGLEPGGIEGLERTRLELAEDPRLSQADRFEPKLHNMYEDAVLLDSAPGVTLVDDDEDDTLLLG